MAPVWWPMAARGVAFGPPPAAPAAAAAEAAAAASATVAAVGAGIGRSSSRPAIIKLLAVVSCGCWYVVVAT